MPADTILHNAKIATNSLPSFVDALAITGANIIATGNDRDIGAMTNWTPRELEIDLSFLPKGKFRMEAYQDGVNAKRMASDYKLVKTETDGTARVKIRLGQGGGWAARIRP